MEAIKNADLSTLLIFGVGFLAIIAFILRVTIVLIVEHAKDRKTAQNGYSARGKILAIKEDKDSTLTRVMVEYHPQLENDSRKTEIYINSHKLRRLSPEFNEAFQMNLSELFKRAKEATALNTQLKDRGYSKQQIAETLEEKYNRAPLERRAKAEELGLSSRWEGLLDPIELPIIIDKEDPNRIVIDYKML